MSLFSKATWLVKYLSHFSSLADVRAYVDLRNARTPPGQQVTLAIRRPAGAALLCRSATSDAEVLWDVFWGRYHLPKAGLPRDPVIFDLGANVGYSCLDLATRFPGARVVGVEMDADNVAIARHNTAVLGEACQVFHAAVWREDGEVSYSKGDEEWGYHISQGAPGSTKVTVRAVSVETLMQEAGVEWVDYLKMDIEGAEDEVLVPDAQWLEHIGELNIELHAPATYEKCAEILTGAGFECVRSARHKNSIQATRRERRG